MGAQISGPGVGLEIPQFLYPSQIIPGTIPYDVGTPQVCLNAGDELPIRAGNWYISLGTYCVLEWLDPLTTSWQIVATASRTQGPMFVKSDGFNLRVANRLGCPVGAVVTAPGNGSYVQASTTISVIGSTATFAPIVGGQLTMFTATVVTANAGAGYGVSPLVIIPPPPPANVNANGVGGIPASGYASIASGTVSGFTFTNPGAGYPSGTTYTVVPLPNPTDPNLTTGITNATLVFSVIASGSLTGVINTNPGAPITPANITLTVGGAGASATVSAVILQTVTAASVVGGSTIGGSSFAALTTAGGGYPTSTFTNSPEFLGLKAVPRPALINLTTGAVGTVAAQVGSIVDGGIFFSAPNPILQTTTIAQGVGSVTGASTITLTMGSRPDIVWLQPAP